MGTRASISEKLSARRHFHTMLALAIKICSSGSSVASHLAAVPLLGTHNLIPFELDSLELPRQNH